jgi:hypothetical protein
MSVTALRKVVARRLLGLAVVALATSHLSAAQARPGMSGTAGAPPSAICDGGKETEAPTPHADFRGQTASQDVRDLADWAKASCDNHTLPFVIIDKINARVFVFDRRGDIRGATAALLGLGRGDDSVAGIGHRKLSTITPAERTTPAGRFQASLGHDFVQDILWIDYDAALSLHRVIVGSPKERRAERLASATVQDNRISFGCINVPAAFYDAVIVPAFTATVGIVYILPETRPLRAVFPLPETRPLSASSGAATR